MRGHAKILDFGLAKVEPGDYEQGGAAGMANTAAADQLTLAGSLMGMVSHMSPEQIRGERLDPRTDLFSFGAVLYEMATGHLPFEGETPEQVFEAILNRTPVPPRDWNGTTPAELERIIGKCLEKDRERRYQSAAEIRADFRGMRRELEHGDSGQAGAPGRGARAWRRELLWPRCWRWPRGGFTSPGHRRQPLRHRWW